MKKIMFNDNNDWRGREHNWRLQDPTHWMPIPEV